MDSPIHFQPPPSPPPSTRAPGHGAFDEESGVQQWDNHENEYFEPSNCSDEDASEAFDLQRGDRANNQGLVRGAFRPSSPGLSSIGDGDVSIVDASGGDDFEGGPGEEDEEGGMELGEANAEADCAPRPEAVPVAAARVEMGSERGGLVDDAARPGGVQVEHPLELKAFLKEDDEAACLEAFPSFPMLTTTAVLDPSPSPSSHSCLKLAASDTCGLDVNNGLKEKGLLVASTADAAAAAAVETGAAVTKPAATAAAAAAAVLVASEEAEASPPRNRKPLPRPHGSLRGGARRVVATATATTATTSTTVAAAATRAAGVRSNATNRDSSADYLQQQQHHQFSTPQKDVSGASGRSPPCPPSSSSPSPSSSERRHGQRLRFAENESTASQGLSDKSRGEEAAAVCTGAPSPVASASRSHLAQSDMLPRPPLPPPSPLHAPKRVTPKHPSSSTPLLANHGKKNSKAYSPRISTAAAANASGKASIGSSAAVAIDLDSITLSSEALKDFANKTYAATSTNAISSPQKKQLQQHQRHQHVSPRAPTPSRSHAKSPRCDPVALFHALQQQRQKDQKAAVKHAKDVMAAREEVLASASSSTTGASATGASGPNAATATAATIVAVPQMSAWARGSAVSVPIGPDGFACSEGQWESRLRRVGSGKSKEARQQRLPQQQHQQSGHPHKSPIPSAGGFSAAPIAAPVFASPTVAPRELFSSPYSSAGQATAEEKVASNEGRSLVKGSVHHKARNAAGVGGEGTPIRLRQAWH